jgi:hypothetical protein
MSEQNPAETLWTLTVEGPNPASELAIYDHSFKLRESGIGRIAARLPAGLYDLEVSIANARERKSVALRAPLTIGADEWDIKADSAAPFSGSLPAGKLHEEKAVLHSRTPTLTATVLAGECRLFVFLRTIKHDAAGKLVKPEQRFWSGFKLCAADGREVSAFADGDLANEVENGWCALTVDLAEGCYILSGPGPKDEDVCLPVWLQPRFETQLFLPIEDGHPVFDQMTLTMAPKNSGFDSGKQTGTEYAAALLTGFRRGENPINPQLVRGMLENQLYNPFAGIVAAHGLLRMRDPDRQLLQTMIATLRQMLGNHPDVVALELMTSPTSGRVLEFPPILRLSFDGVLALSTTNTHVIEVNSLLSDVLGTLFPAQYVLWLRSSDLKAPLLDVAKDLFWGAVTAAPGLFKFFRSSESRTVKVDLDAIITSFENWLRACDGDNLAVQLGLPRSVIDRIIKKIFDLLPAAHRLAKERFKGVELPVFFGGANHIGAAFLNYFSKTDSTSKLSALDRRVIQLVFHRWEISGAGREIAREVEQCQRRLMLLSNTACRARDLIEPRNLARDDAMIVASIMAGLAAKLYPFLLVGHDLEVVVEAGSFAEAAGGKGKFLGKAAAAPFGPAFEQIVRNNLYDGWVFKAKAEEFVPISVRDGLSLEFLRVQENYWAAGIDMTSWPQANKTAAAPSEESVQRGIISLTAEIERYSAEMTELVRVALDPLGPTRPALESLPGALNRLRSQLQQRISDDASTAESRSVA